MEGGEKCLDIDMLIESTAETKVKDKTAKNKI